MIIISTTTDLHFDWNSYLVQPFNVGDFVQINDDQILIVEKVGVLSTYFHAFGSYFCFVDQHSAFFLLFRLMMSLETDGYGVFLRNSQISHSKIVNLNRGGKISFEVQFGLNWDTTAKEVTALNKRLGEYFKNSKVFLIIHFDHNEKMGSKCTINFLI
jgi:small-conductance mechanosensitive channel